MIKKKMLKNTTYRIMAIVLAVTLLTTGMGTVAAASEQNTPKQEIVYINLNADGSVSKVYVVNTFELSENGKIIDYGDYTSLRNMTSDEKIVYENETVSIDAKAGKLYYEGFLSNNSIPWDFSIRYYLNDTELSAEELAGKSGALKIKMNVRENSDCDSPFFENYALQASFTLDTKLCKNIVAKDATTANIGRKKQLTYTILPGKGADAEIYADVTDFEMDGIAINGVPLSMNLEVKVDKDEDINKAAEGIIKLDDGASDMTSGAAKLKDGASDLNNGAADLKEGAADLKSGAEDLQSGAKDLQDGSDHVKQGAKDLHAGISELYSKTPQLVTGGTSMKNGLSDATTGSADLADGAKNLEAGAIEIKDGADNLSSGLTTLSAQNSVLINGAYTVFTSMTAQAEMQINQNLSAMGMPSIALTPENYDVVLTGLLEASGGSTGSHKLPSETPVIPEELIESDVPEELTKPDEPEELTKPDVPEEPAESEVPEQTIEPDASETPTKPVLPEDSDDEGEATSNNGYSDLPLDQQPADAEKKPAKQEHTDTNAEMLSISYATPMVMNLNTYSMKRTEVFSVNSYVQSGGVSSQTILAIKAQLDEYNQFYLGLKNYTKAVDAAAFGAEGLKSGGNDLAAGASLLRTGANSLNDGLVVLKNGSTDMLAGLIELQSGCGKLLDGTIVLEDGTVQLNNGIVELSDGTIALLDGATTLYDGVIDLCDGSLTLYDGSVTLYDGTRKLKDGTMEFRDKTADIDTTINDKITSAVNDMMGADFEPVSFVSDQNTNVEFVQFVVKTDAIEKTDTTAVIPEEEPLTFWQKILKLFGLI